MSHMKKPDVAILVETHAFCALALTHGRLCGRAC